MRASVPTLSAAQATAASIDVGQLTIGPATIGRLVVRNAHFAMSMGRGELRNMRITITLRLSLEWRVHVDLLVTDINEGGTWDLPDPSFTIGFGNVTLPGLTSLTVDLNEMTAQNLTASTGPIAGLHLGAIIAEQIRMRDAVVPSAAVQRASQGNVVYVVKEDNTVTLRFRDSMQQERIPLDSVRARIEQEIR